MENSDNMARIKTPVTETIDYLTRQFRHTPLLQDMVLTQFEILWKTGKVSEHLNHHPRERDIIVNAYNHFKKLAEGREEKKREGGLP